MKKEGLIYHYGWKQYSGEVAITIQRRMEWNLTLPNIDFPQNVVRYFGSALIVVGLAGVIFSFAPVISAEVSYRFTNITGGYKQNWEDQVLVKQAHAEEQEKERTRQIAQDLGLPNSYFSIYIPKINAKAQIIENVDPYNQKVYIESLSKGVAHAAGSVFPGMQGGTYLFAHSSAPIWQAAKYNTVFYLLKELKPRSDKYEGDEIYVFFLDKLYKYRVIDKHTVGPGDVTWLANTKQGPERLILQTCWPPGTDLKRLIVVAEPI